MAYALRGRRRKISEQENDPISTLESLEQTEKSVPDDLMDAVEKRFSVRLTGLKVTEDKGLLETGERAYARGNEIHFAEGAFNPGTEAGREEFLHEAGHVVQMGMGLAKGDGLLSDSSLEASATMGFSADSSFSMPTDASMAPAMGLFGWHPFRKRREQREAERQRQQQEAQRQQQEAQRQIDEANTLQRPGDNARTMLQISLADPEKARELISNPQLLSQIENMLQRSKDYDRSRITGGEEKGNGFREMNSEIASNMFKSLDSPEMRAKMNSDPEFKQAVLRQFSGSLAAGIGAGKEGATVKGQLLNAMAQMSSLDPRFASLLRTDEMKAFSQTALREEVNPQVLSGGSNYSHSFSPMRSNTPAISGFGRILKTLTTQGKFGQGAATGLTRYAEAAEQKQDTEEEKATVREEQDKALNDITDAATRAVEDDPDIQDYLEGGLVMMEGSSAFSDEQKNEMMMNQFMLRSAGPISTDIAQLQSNGGADFARMSRMVRGSQELMQNINKTMSGEDHDKARKIPESSQKSSRAFLGFLSRLLKNKQ